MRPSNPRDALAHDTAIVFEFYVHDSEGFWGSVKVTAATLEDANRRARTWLKRNGTRPNGSLLSDFALTLKEDLL